MPNAPDHSLDDTLAKFIDAFLRAAIATLKVQASYDVKASPPHILTSDEAIPTDVCSVMVLKSKVVSGTICLCFSKGIFLKAMSNILGETFSEVTEEIAEGAGELLNMTFGQAKQVLNDNGVGLEKALPVVYHLPHTQVQTLTGGAPTICVPFRGADGALVVLISMRQTLT